MLKTVLFDHLSCIPAMIVTQLGRRCHKNQRITLEFVYFLKLWICCIFKNDFKIFQQQSEKVVLYKYLYHPSGFVVSKGSAMFT